MYTKKAGAPEIHRKNNIKKIPVKFLVFLVNVWNFFLLSFFCFF